VELFCRDSRASNQCRGNVQDINLIWTAIEGANGPRALDQIGTQDTRDEAAQEWEFELVGNLTKTWSVRASYATPKTVQIGAPPSNDFSPGGFFLGASGDIPWEGTDETPHFAFRVIQ